jgi:hypothetical protein
MLGVEYWTTSCLVSSSLTVFVLLLFGTWFCEKFCSGFFYKNSFKFIPVILGGIISLSFWKLYSQGVAKLIYQGQVNGSGILNKKTEEYCSVSDRTQRQMLRECIYEYLRYVREVSLDKQVG